MLRDFRHLEKGTKKMADPYDGPYYVLDVLSDVNFRIAKSEQHDAKIVHHDRMKPIKRREDDDIQWVYKQSRTRMRQQLEKSGLDLKCMKSVTDRLTALEQQIAKSNLKLRKRKRKELKESKELDVQEKEKPKKRGRPRIEELTHKKKSEKPRRGGERRSERLRNKKL